MHTSRQNSSIFQRCKIPQISAILRGIQVRSCLLPVSKHPGSIPANSSDAKFRKFQKLRASAALSFSAGLITSTRAFLHTGNIQSGTDNRLVRATVSASTQAPVQLFPAIKLDTRYYTKYTQSPFQLFPASKLYTRYTLYIMHACSPPVLFPSNSSDPLRP